MVTDTFMGFASANPCSKSSEEQSELLISLYLLGNVHITNSLCLQEKIERSMVHFTRIC